MPMASAANLAPILGADERPVRARLSSLQRARWIDSLHVWMTEPRQHRWFLTTQAIGELYTQDDAHVTAELASPFRDPPPAGPAAPEGRERLPWTATARGARSGVRRLAALELLYRLAPGLLRSGWLLAPPGDAAAAMTDFHLVRKGGWFHAVAHYGERYWVSFTYVGMHATEWSLRRKRAKRFWGIDVYTSRHDAHERAADRTFYDGPRHEARPSAEVMLAADSWAAHLAQREFAPSTRPLICTPAGLWGDPVTLQPSDDRVSDPVAPVLVGQPEHLKVWRQSRADTLAITDPLAFAVFMAVAQFPAIRGAEIARFLGRSPRPVERALAAIVKVGLVDRLDGHCYLTATGLRRAANLSRLLPSAVIRRHGAYSMPSFRNKNLRHDRGVNRVAVQLASEGAEAFVGWRGDINVPYITQIKPDLLVLVSDGTLGPGAYSVEYERTAVWPSAVTEKLQPYRRCAAIGRPVPLLVVCETPETAELFSEYDALLPMLVTHLGAIETGRLTGDNTIWQLRGADTVSLYCRR